MSEVELQLPLFGSTVDDADVNVFESVADAEAYIEIYDINDWRVYDADGKVVALKAEGDRVRLEPTRKTDPDALRELLRNHAKAAKIEVDGNVDLTTLVRKVRQFDEQFRSRERNMFATIGGYFGVGIALMGVIMLFLSWPLGVFTLIFAFFFLRDWNHKRKLK